jgi:hypothetical protein
VVASFDPKIHLLTKCVGIEYQNRVVQQRGPALLYDR